MSIQEGTAPNDATSFRPRLVTTTPNGAISPAHPDATTYALNSKVTLTGTPAPGYTFVNWIGDASGRINPLVVTIDVAKTIGARLQTQRR